MNEPKPKHGKVLFATAGYDHTIRFWNIDEANCYHILQHPDSQVNDLDFSSDRKYLAAAGYRHIRIYDNESTNTNPVVNFEGHSKNIFKIGFNLNNNWLYSIGEEGSLYIIDYRVNTKIQRSKQIPNAQLNCGFLHPNQIYLLSGSKEGKLYIWDLRADELHSFIPEPILPILSISIDNIGTNIAVSNDQGLCSVWPIDKTILTQSEVDRTLTAIVKQTATTIKQEADKMDAITKKFIDTSQKNGLVNDADSSPKLAFVYPPVYMPLHKSTQFKAHNKRYILKTELSPDSQLLATCSDEGDSVVWNVKENKILQKFSNPSRKWVWDAAFTKDSQYLMTASSDCKARLWEIKTGNLKREFSGHQKAIICLAMKD
ncbi:unnamed protein product [Gordionus sp. m RMFG-2023]|uniref:target of rapamycin complex subunit lst8-like n=1 Tax=Gordionus sp. m RMFG-2023 TaxID=3053472 RepID=UPI0030E1655F